MSLVDHLQPFSTSKDQDCDMQMMIVWVWSRVWSVKSFSLLRETESLRPLRVMGDGPGIDSATTAYSIIFFFITTRTSDGDYSSETSLTDGEERWRDEGFSYGLT